MEGAFWGSRLGVGRARDLVVCMASFLLFCLVACKRGDDAAPSALVEHKAPGVDVQLTDAALTAAALVIERPVRSKRRTNVVSVARIELPPSRVARVGPAVEGRVTSLRVEPGQRVEKGTVLASLESAELGRARADVLSARTREKAAEVELEREKTLTDQRLGTGKSLVAAQTEVSLSRLGTQAAHERLRALGAQGGSGSSLTLSAPINGAVLDVHARIGQVAGPSDVLFVVGETDVLWALADIFERDLGSVRVGDEAHVSVLAYPGKVFHGKVEALGQLVSAERRTVEARIVLGEHGGLLRPGMTATARCFGDVDGSTALTVPRGAVTNIDGQPYVFLERERGAFELRAVERGPEVEGRVEIARGLAESDAVVVDGAFILKSEFLREQMGKND